jgi:uncharacterized protein
MDTTMSETLNAEERRVLGVLLEKSLTHPQYYPMSINAIVTGCNQKSNRDPVTDLDEETVWNTLERLRVVGLVTRLMPGGASRVDRFKHEVKPLLGWEKPQWAVMAELLLRGPQTAGELRGRCARMYPFENGEMVAAVLDNFEQANPPRVTPLPRGPGQSAVRYAHRLYTPEEWARLAEHAASAAAPAVSTPASSSTSPAVSSSGPQSTPSLVAEVEKMRGDLADLQAKIGDMNEQLADLRRRMEALGG